MSIATLLLSPLAQSVEIAPIDNSGFFISAQIGNANSDLSYPLFSLDSLLTNPLHEPGKIHIKDKDTGYGINFGYRWGWFGVEAGYVDFGKLSSTANVTIPSVTWPNTYVLLDTEPSPFFPYIAKLQGYTAGINGRFNFADHWYLNGRGGLLRFEEYGPKISITSIDDGRTVQVGYRESGLGGYAGVGVGYNITDNFSMGLNYDYFSGKKSDNYDVHLNERSFKLNSDLKLRSDLVSVAAEYRFR